MRAPAILVLLAAVAASVPASAQTPPGHDMGRMTPQALAQHCAAMRQDMARGSHPNTPDMQRMMAQCEEQDRGAAAASRRR